MQGFRGVSILPVASDLEEEGGSISGGLILVPPGEYALHYIDYETASAFGHPKVVVNFAIAEPSEYAGSPISRYYNVKALSGRPQRFGNYIAAAKGDLVREYCTLRPERKRLDRISWRWLKGKLVLGEVRTVERDSKGGSLPEATGYSVIAKLLRVLPEFD